MNDREEDQYIKIIPLKEIDYQKIHKKKNINPLQKIKVSNNTPLSTLSNYIQKFTKADQGNISVSLYAPCNPDCIQLPLSLTISEYVLITGKDEVRYSFITKNPDSGECKDEPTTAGVEVGQKIQKNDTPFKTCNSNIGYPMPPMFQDAAPSTGFIQHNEDSQIGPLFHSGFSIFSNSFGPYLSNIDTTYTNTEPKETTEPISLRKDLEQILQNSS